MQEREGAADLRVAHGQAPARRIARLARKQFAQCVGEHSIEQAMHDGGCAQLAAPRFGIKQANRHGQGREAFNTVAPQHEPRRHLAQEGVQRCVPKLISATDNLRAHQRGGLLRHARKAPGCGVDLRCIGCGLQRKEMLAAARHQGHIASLQRNRLFQRGRDQKHLALGDGMQANAFVARKAHRRAGHEGAEVQQAALQAGLLKNVGQDVHSDIIHEFGLRDMIFVFLTIYRSHK